MGSPDVQIRKVGPLDLPTVTKMAHANMPGADRRFTELVDHPLGRLVSYVTLPVYLLLAGRGYKAVADGKTVGCAFLHLRRESGFVFNVNVNRSHRRQGIGSRLMYHVEQVTREEGMRWTILQVDGDNVPARQMYVRLGYRTYHPHFLRLEGSASSGDSGLDDPCPGSSSDSTTVADEVAVRPLGRSKGRARFRRYRRVELQAGDSWAAEPLSEYTPELRGGRFYSCRVAAREVGCAWSGTAKGQPLIRLNLSPGVWNDPAVCRLVRLLTATHSQAWDYVDVYPGSRGHLEAAAPLLFPLGFEIKEQLPLLMVKELQKGQSTGRNRS
jgi:ribosomal protein S18 acetylase RimI-like enzyme